MIKNTQQTRLEVNFLKMVKGIHEKLTANILINGERQSFPPKTRLPAFTIAIQHCTRSPRQNIKARQRTINQTVSDYGRI